jgi:hypothetical protein
MKFNLLKAHNTYDTSLQIDTIASRKLRIELIKELQGIYECTWEEALVLYNKYYSC